jgi:hypothetical protein
MVGLRREPTRAVCYPDVIPDVLKAYDNIQTSS